MNIHVYHHFSPDPDVLSKKLDAIAAQLRAIYQQGTVLMSKADEMLADLQDAFTVTNEIADDLDALILKSQDEGLSEAERVQVHESITALGGRLRAVADKYPVAPPPET